MDDQQCDLSGSSNIVEIWPYFLLHNSVQEGIKRPVPIDAMSALSTMKLIWIRWQSWPAVYCQLRHHRFFSCLPFSPRHKVNSVLARDPNTINHTDAIVFWLTEGAETFLGNSVCLESLPGCFHAAVRSQIQQTNANHTLWTFFIVYRRKNEATYTHTHTLVHVYINTHTHTATTNDVLDFIHLPWGYQERGRGKCLLTILCVCVRESVLMCLCSLNVS